MLVTTARSTWTSHHERLSISLQGLSVKSLPLSSAPRPSSPLLLRSYASVSSCRQHVDTETVCLENPETASSSNLTFGVRMGRPLAFLAVVIFILWISPQRQTGMAIGLVSV